MKYCTNCRAQLDDAVTVCPQCGTAQAPAPEYAQPQGQPVPPQQPYAPYPPQQPYVPYVDPYDHTAEFDPRDISENKVYAALPYLASLIGIIIALLASKDSPYTRFHIRQALKLEICMALLCVAAAVLCWTILVPVAAAVCLLILLVVDIICLFQVFGGKAKEAAIVRGFGFLK